MRSTLLPLIRQKLVETVPWTKDEVRIPVTELRRLQRDGIPSVKPRRERRPATAKASGQAARVVAAGIRSIKIK